MTKTTVQIEGMMCPMCEAHMNEAVRKAFPVKKVTSSHKEKKAEIISEEPLDEEQLKAVVAAAGYTFKGLQTEPYEKKGFSLFKK